MLLAEGGNVAGLDGHEGTNSLKWTLCSEGRTERQLSISHIPVLFAQRSFGMNTEQFVAHSRFSFALLRWLAITASISLPFTFGRGAISLAHFFGACLIAVVWLFSLLLAWRSRNEVWFGLGFVVLIFGSRFTGIHNADVPMPQYVQWLCIVVILAGFPLLLFRRHLLRLSRLD